MSASCCASLDGSRAPGCVADTGAAVGVPRNPHDHVERVGPGAQPKPDDGSCEFWRTALATSASRSLLEGGTRTRTQRTVVTLNLRLPGVVLNPQVGTSDATRQRCRRILGNIKPGIQALSFDTVRTRIPPRLLRKQPVSVHESCRPLCTCQRTRLLPWPGSAAHASPSCFATVLVSLSHAMMLRAPMTLSMRNVLLWHSRSQRPNRLPLPSAQPSAGQCSR